MAELMPIFNEIRARGECGNAYPLHVGSHASGPIHLHTHHVNPNTCYMVMRDTRKFYLLVAASGQIVLTSPDQVSTVLIVTNLIINIL
ncbi:unnamed protein product [Acanthoscelides obtectus]|uniref:Uncharacterized protein n=1 Tax=Acanthoscelides obtectus TaxID=200917 RepID=A0A9P0PMP6_ACAOB|nr:unnamed protein product [Acanthoscelides obtectus]CAK1674287.1 hypothetical protein AOBTE_LOCUS29579 [Acanthoscelides obtectus]